MTTKETIEGLLERSEDAFIVTDLIAEGVDGIHLYTMNNPYIAHKIYDAVQNLVAAKANAC